MLNNGFVTKNRGGYRLQLIYIFFSIFVLLLLSRSIPVYAASGTVANDDFVFDASIDEKRIKDGTAPFDIRQESGYDVNNHNGIVRTFDTVTYPLKITINPKKASSLKNIKLKITGSLENGVTDKKRVNAVFSLGNKTDIMNNAVTFAQDYTVQQTGNSIMLPIAVEVKGATNGLKIRPNINIEVVSVDGVAVKDKVKVVLNDLPYVTVSAKVSIRPRLSYIYGTNGYYAYGIDPRIPKTDRSMVQSVGLAFEAIPVKDLSTGKQKTSIIGSTFPEGKIHFHFEMDGMVYFDDGRKQSLRFSDGYNKIPQLFAFYDVGVDKHFTETKNASSEGLGQFTWYHANTVGVPRSRMNYKDLNVVKNQWRYSAWDSGSFEVTKPKVIGEKVRIDGINDNFVIGDMFPIYRADGYSNVAVESFARVFSTVGLIIQSPNEYAINYGHNKEGIGSNTYYNLSVFIDSYEDKNQKQYDISGQKFVCQLSERNNPAGAYSMENAFWNFNNEQLGTKVIGNHRVSNGDATIIRGQDVQFAGYVYSSGAFSLGGVNNFYYWNVDSFELTKAYAEKTKREWQRSWTLSRPDDTRNPDETKIFVRFGVPKNIHQDGASLAKNTYDSYIWYDSYEDAVKHGPIGAMCRDVQYALGNQTFCVGSVYLHVKTKKVGSINEFGTENMVFQKAIIYPSEDRKDGFLLEGLAPSFSHASQYDELGNLIDKQAPVGSTINFDTLGIVNGNLSTNIESDRNVYYATDTITWTVENRSVLPNNVNFNEGEKATFTQKIPKGLNYIPDSYQLNDKLIEPKVIFNQDGSTDLIYDYYLSSNINTLPKIKFQTSVNPLVLNGDNQQDLTVTSVISDPDLDTRDEKFRTGTKTIKIAKVGMVGVHSTLIPNSGKKNSQFILRLQPYTTIDDEPNVRGVFQIPENKDDNGSMFSGSAYLKAIRTEIPKDKSLKVYISDTRVNESNPNKIDVSRSPWKAVDLNGSNDVFKNAKTVYFEVQGLLAKSDVVTLDFDIQTSGNNFGDLYFMKASLNSDSHYKLSPESNKVRYEVIPDAALKFQVIRMYTDKASKGIKGNVTISKEIYDKKSNNQSIDLVIVDKTTQKEVYRKSYTIGSIPDNLSFNVLPKDLTVNTHHNYEARFDRYDGDVIFVPNRYDKIDVDGYTSSEMLLKSTNDAIKYKGVIMTERVIGEDITYKYETLNIGALKNIKTKSGYGIDVNQQLKVKYKNDFDKTYDVKAALDIDKALASSELTYGDGVGSMKRVKLVDQLLEGQFSYELPEVMVHKGDGKLAFVNEKNQNQGDWLNGGKQLYIPIWIKALQKYPIDFVSTNEIGINAVNFDSKAYIDVYAYMYEASESDTIQHDEVMLKPEMQK